MKKDGLYLICGLYVITKNDNGWDSHYILDGVFDTGGDLNFYNSFEIDESNALVVYGSMYDTHCWNNFDGILGIIPFYTIIEKKDGNFKNKIMDLDNNNSYNLIPKNTFINVKIKGKYYETWSRSWSGTKILTNYNFKYLVTELCVSNNLKIEPTAKSLYNNQIKKIILNDKGDKYLSINKEIIFESNNKLNIELCELVDYSEHWGSDYAYICLAQIGIYPLS